MARRFDNAQDDCKKMAKANPGTHYYAIPTTRTRRFYRVVSEQQYRDGRPRPEWQRPRFAWVVQDEEAQDGSR